jgi:hypothetical protein
MSAGASAIRAGGAYAELSVEDSRLVGGLAKAEARMKAWGKSVEGIGKKLATVGGLVAGPLLGVAKVFADVGSQFQDMADRTGTSVEALSELDYAASLSGTSMETLEKGIKKMQQNLADAETGGAGAVKMLESLGLSAAALQGLAPDQQFEMIAERIASIEDPAQRTAAAMDVFGKAGAELLPLMSQGARGIQMMREQGRALGVTISGETAAAAAEFGDKLDSLWKQVTATAVAFGAQLLPVLEKWVAIISDGLSWLTSFAKEHGTLLQVVLSTAGGLTVFGTAAIGVGKAMGVMGAGLGLLQTGFTGVKSAIGGLVTLFPLLASPIGIIIGITAAVAGLVAGLAYLVGGFEEVSHEMENQRKLGDQQREDDDLRLQRLQQLADKQRLNTQEMSEANGIIAELESRYGRLGVSINTTTGQIEGMTDAQKRLNAAMRAQENAQLNKEILEAEKNLKILEKEYGEFFNGEVWDLVPWAEGTIWQGSESRNKDIEKAAADLAVERERLKAMKERRSAGDAAQSDKADPKNIAQTRERLQAEARKIEEARKQSEAAEQRLEQLNEQDRRGGLSPLEREIDDLRKQGEERKKLLDQLIAGEQTKPGGGDGAKMEQLNAQRAAVDGDTQARIDELEKADEKKRQEKDQEQQDQIAERKAAAEQQIQDQIDQLGIEGQFQAKPGETADDAAKRDLAKQKAMLELERQQALRDAGESGTDPELINKLFALREKAAEATARAQGTPEVAKSVTSGTFSAAAAARLGGSIPEKQLVELKKINENLAGVKGAIEAQEESEFV